VLDDYGSVQRIQINPGDGGTGYDANTVITFDTNVTAVGVIGCGMAPQYRYGCRRGAIATATVITSGSNYGSAPSLVVTDSGSGSGAILQPVYAERRNGWN